MSQFNVSLNNKTAIVTGAGAGIGRAVALALGRAGAAVGVNDINPDRAASVAEAIHEAGGQAVDFQGDISNRFQAAALIERTRDAFGSVHILVNAAGVYHNREFSRVDEWDWRRQIDVNLTGAFFCTQLISRVMTEELGGGVIVNIAAANWNDTLESGVGYVASKAGMVGLTRQSARELAPVRVNAVCPGHIDGDDMPVAPDNMLKRLGTPEDVADVVLFLCSDAARFITGQTLHVDGGGL